MSTQYFNFLLNQPKLDDRHMDDCGIYSIRNVINGKSYIGLTGKTFRLRLSQHLCGLISGNHSNKRLQEDFLLYDLKSFKFEILDVKPLCKEGFPDFRVAEALWITYRNADHPDFGYNGPVSRSLNRQQLYEEGTKVTQFPNIVQAQVVYEPYCNKVWERLPNDHIHYALDPQFSKVNSLEEIIQILQFWGYTPQLEEIHFEGLSKTYVVIKEGLIYSQDSPTQEELIAESDEYLRMDRVFGNRCLLSVYRFDPLEKSTADRIEEEIELDDSRLGNDLDF